MNASTSTSLKLSAIAFATAMLFGCGGGSDAYVATLDAACAPPCVGNLNGDNTVNMDDLLILLRHWGPCPQ